METQVNIKLHKKNVYYTLTLTGVDEDFDPQDEGIIAISNEFIKFITGDPTAQFLESRGDLIPTFKELIPVSVQLTQCGLDACLWTIVFHLDFFGRDEDEVPKGVLLFNIERATQKMLLLDEGTVDSPFSVNLVEDYLTIQFTVG